MDNDPGHFFAVFSGDFMQSLDNFLHVSILLVQGYGGRSGLDNPKDVQYIYLFLLALGKHFSPPNSSVDVTFMMHSVFPLVYAAFLC